MKRKKLGPGASWSTSGRNNRKPREDGSSCNPQIRADVLAEFALNGIKREARRAAKGTTPAKRVIHCPGCGCPVVDSLQGRERHGKRAPNCKEVISMS